MDDLSQIITDAIEKNFAVEENRWGEGYIPHQYGIYNS